MSKEHKEEHNKEADHLREGLSKPGQISPFQPASEPYPQPEDPPNTPPWEKAEFKKKVLEAGFPGSPGSDTAFLAALYKFGGGKIEDYKPESVPEPSSPPEHKHK